MSEEYQEYQEIDTCIYEKLILKYINFKVSLLIIYTLNLIENIFQYSTV